MLLTAFSRNFFYDDGAKRGRVLGFPIMAAAFDSEGRDYVGPITPLALAGNALFFALLPQIGLWIVARRHPPA